MDEEGVVNFSFPSVDVFVGESTTKLAPWDHVPRSSTKLECILMGNDQSKKQSKIFILPPFFSI